MGTSTLEPQTSSTTTNANAGKYLTFVLGHESYGISVLKVREIIRLMDITSVPQMPPYVKGVINLRGKVVPIVDLRIKFGLAHAESSERTCIVVVQVRTLSGGSAFMGFIVDGVEEVTNFASNEIEPTPDFGSKLDTDYILGMAKIRGKVKTLLDIDRLLTSETLEQLTQAAQAA
jgi:purine-binding chemotaxis protein CheW